MSRNGKTRSALKIKRVSSQLELVQVFTIRIRVFVREQRVPAEIELDADDQRAIHFLAINSGKAVGTARVVMRHGAREDRAHGCAEELSTQGRRRGFTQARHFSGEKIARAADLPIRTGVRDWLLRADGFSCRRENFR